MADFGTIMDVIDLVGRVVKCFQKMEKHPEICMALLERLESRKSELESSQAIEDRFISVREQERYENLEKVFVKADLKLQAVLRKHQTGKSSMCSKLCGLLPMLFLESDVTGDILHAVENDILEIDHYLMHTHFSGIRHNSVKHGEKLQRIHEDMNTHWKNLPKKLATIIKNKILPHIPAPNRAIPPTPRDDIPAPIPLPLVSIPVTTPSGRLQAESVINNQFSCSTTPKRFGASSPPTRETNPEIDPNDVHILDRQCRTFLKRNPSLAMGHARQAVKLRLDILLSAETSFHKFLYANSLTLLASCFAELCFRENYFEEVCLWSEWEKIIQECTSIYRILFETSHRYQVECHSKLARAYYNLSYVQLNRAQLEKRSISPSALKNATESVRLFKYLQRHVSDSKYSENLMEALINLSHIHSEVQQHERAMSRARDALAMATTSELQEKCKQRLEACEVNIRLCEEQRIRRASPASSEEI